MEPLDIWRYALAYCRNEGLDDERLSWCRNLPQPSDVSDSYFFAELTWCVYNAGMAERIVRMKGVCTICALRAHLSQSR